MIIETMMEIQEMQGSAQRSEEFLQPKNGTNLLLPVISKLNNNKLITIK